MYAAIDLGTNTVRLLLGEVIGGKVQPAGSYRRITRLGGGYSLKKGLSEDAIQRTLEALNEFALILEGKGVKHVAVFGTAALRTAPNASEFQDRLQKATGFSLEIISGDQEAVLSCRGVLSGLVPPPEKCLIFDVGGGSSEFVLYQSGRILFHRSYPLGVVSLSEQYPLPSKQSIVIEGIIDSFFADLFATHVDPTQLKLWPLIGTAGTITTLAAVHLGLTAYDSRLINGLVLTSHQLAACKNRLCSIPVHERELLPGMEKGRGDLILPGLMIVEAVLQRLGQECLMVSDSGLLEGILLFQSEGRRLS